MTTSRNVVFIVLAGSLLTFTMQFAMVSVGLPEVIRELNAPLRWGGWILTIFMVGQIISMPVSGKLADQFGARNVFLTGFVIFMSASAVCAASPNIAVMIGARFIQGLAGGSLLPAGMGIIGATFQENRARAVGLFSSLMPIGAIIGPTLGGFIVDHLGWRWTFLVNVPAGFVMFIVGFLLLPRSPRGASHRIDVGGITLLGVSVLALIFALTELGQRNVDPNMALVFPALGIFLLGLVWLVRHEMRTPEPVLAIDLIKRREFAFANVLSLCFGAGLLGMFSVLPLYAQAGYGMTASETGTMIVPRAAFMAGVSMLSAILLPYTGYRIPILTGLITMSGLLVLFSLGLEEPNILGIEFSNFAWLTTVAAATGLAFGFANPSLNNAGLDLAPDRIPVLTGMRGMFMTLGGTIGLSLIVLIASRAETVAAGLEFSFLLLAGLLTVTTLLVFGLPEMPAHARAGRAHRPLQPASPVPPSPDIEEPRDAGPAAVPGIDRA